MIRGNERAELTHSHANHGDTEYRYTVHGNSLKVEKGYGDKWHTVYDGDWVDFINKHVPASGRVENFQPVKRVDVDETQKAVPHTEASLQKVLDADLHLCGIWASNGNGTGYNMESLQRKIKNVTAILNIWNAA